MDYSFINITSRSTLTRRGSTYKVLSKSQIEMLNNLTVSRQMTDVNEIVNVT